MTGQELFALRERAAGYAVSAKNACLAARRSSEVPAVAAPMQKATDLEVRAFSILRGDRCRSFAELPNADLDLVALNALMGLGAALREIQRAIADLEGLLAGATHPDIVERLEGEMDALHRARLYTARAAAATKRLATAARSERSPA